MRLAMALLATTLLFSARIATADTLPAWDIDSAHSRAAFSVRHLGISNVTGEFTKVTGTALYDGKDVGTASVQALIDVSTINTREAKRDEHLKSADFFDAAKYPTITFKSRRLRPTMTGKFQLTGDLTIHGVTKTVVLAGEVTKTVKDPWGNTRFGASASGQINRQDFGLTWNKTMDSGGVVVGDEVTLTLDVELVQKK